MALFIETLQEPGQGNPLLSWRLLPLVSVCHSAFAQSPQSPESPQFRLCPGGGFHAGGAFALCKTLRVVGAATLVVVGQDVAACRRIVLAQFPLLPPEVQVQRGAISLQDAVRQLLDAYRFVDAIHQPVASQLSLVVVPVSSKRQYSDIPSAS